MLLIPQDTNSPTLASVGSVVPETWSTLPAVWSVDPMLAGTLTTLRVTELHKCSRCITIAWATAWAGVKAEGTLLENKRESILATNALLFIAFIKWRRCLRVNRSRIKVLPRSGRNCARWLQVYSDTDQCEGHMTRFHKENNRTLKATKTHK